MTVVSETYLLESGAAPVIFNPAFAYVTILRVRREGIGYNNTGGGTPGNREFVHTIPSPYIVFQNPAEGLPGTDVGTERVTVIYKT